MQLQPSAGGAWRSRVSTASRAAQPMGCPRAAVANSRHAAQLQAVGDVVAQLSNIDTSSMPASVQAVVSDLLAPIPDLPPHFGTLAVKGKIQEVYTQLQALGDSLGAVQSVQQVLEPVQGMVTSLDQQRSELLSQLTTSTASLTLPSVPAPSLGSVVSQPPWGAAAGTSGFAAPVTGAHVKAMVDQLTSGLVLPPGAEHLQPHWGTAAMQEVLNAAATSDLGAALTHAAEGAASLVTAAETLEPAAVLEAAGDQLRQAAQLLASAPQGFLAGSLVSSVVDDLRMVLAALPATPDTASLTGSLPSPADLTYLGWPAAAAQLADKLRLAVEQGRWAGHDLAALALAAAGVTLAVGWSARVAPTAVDGQVFDGPDAAERELGYEYDPVKLDEYVSRRPIMVMKRAAQVSVEMAAFGLALLSDIATGKLDSNEPLRAQQLRFAIERLGPAYVKVAQALSTRVDLLTPAYFEQIQLLQDRVPPFPCEVARAAMVDAFGRPVEQVFSQLSDKPVAAASLGQVYRGTLIEELGGFDVAVKVQRPGVLAAVALDLALIRWLAQATAASMTSDWVSIIDAWAVRFFHEMDYQREADNAEKFAKDMEQIQGIAVPTPIRSLSTHNVLTTAWVEGERLSESRASDVRQLCDTLLTAYLVQLLETGFLHADPHPGNLLRTPDGRIAVLDYGLMTEVTEAQRWALLEYIAHLSTRDWEKLALDLQTMGFIPPEVDPKERGLVEPLGRIMSQLVGGGGAAKVNIDKVIGDLEQLGDNYPFQIPAFFALILRAFSVIEGIALEVDPDYAIVAECFPYLSRRLLSDDTPRARALLKDILYGNRKRLDVDRLIRLADGFSSYTTDGLVEQVTVTSASTSSSPASVSGALSQNPALRRMMAQAGVTTSSFSSSDSTPRAASTPPSAQRATQDAAARRPSAVDSAAKDALLTIFSKRGSYVQELLVEEAAAAVDALSVSAAASLLMTLAGAAPFAMPSAQGADGSSSSGASAGSSASANTPVAVMAMAMNALAGTAAGTGVLTSGPAPGLLSLLPSSVWSRVQPLVQLTDDDKEALAVVQGIAQLFLRAAGGGKSTPDGATAAAPATAAGSLAQIRATVVELGPLLPQLAPGLALTVRQFVMALLQRARARLDRALRGEPFPATTTTDSTAATTSYDQQYSSSSSSSNGTQSAGTVSMRRTGTTSTAGTSASSQNGYPSSRPASGGQGRAARPVPDQDMFSVESLLGSGGRIGATAASQVVGGASKGPKVAAAAAAAATPTSPTPAAP